MDDQVPSEKYQVKFNHIGPQRIADSGRWYCLEGHPDSGTTQETSSYNTTHTLVTFMPW